MGDSRRCCLAFKRGAGWHRCYRSHLDLTGDLMSDDTLGASIVGSWGKWIPDSSRPIVTGIE